MVRKPSEIKLMSRVAALISAKELRDNRRYKQAEIAKQTGLTESTISRLVNGIGMETVAFGKAITLAKWLGVKVDALYEMEEPA